jgi:hypothetical protein
MRATLHLPPVPRANLGQGSCGRPGARPGSELARHPPVNLAGPAAPPATTDESDRCHGWRSPRPRSPGTPADPARAVFIGRPGPAPQWPAPGPSRRSDADDSQPQRAGLRRPRPGTRKPGARLPVARPPPVARRSPPAAGGIAGPSRPAGLDRQVFRRRDSPGRAEFPNSGPTIERFSHAQRPPYFLIHQPPRFTSAPTWPHGRPFARTPSTRLVRCVQQVPTGVGPPASLDQT